MLSKGRRPVEWIPLREHYDTLRAIDNERRRETLIVLTLVIASVIAEMLRRLGILNHAHEAAIEVQHTYVTDEKFGDFVKRYEENRETTSKALTLAEGKGRGSAELKASTVGWVSAIAALALVVIYLVHP
jgi:thymidine phosphorylase